jgi:hypothetical protein
MRGLAGAAAFIAISEGSALAESPSGVTESMARYLIAQCMDWRVSGGVRGQRRVPLGRPSDGICREVVQRVAERGVEQPEAGAKWAPLVSLTRVCRGIAEQLAGQSVDLSQDPSHHDWGICETWGHIQAGIGFVAAPYPPDDIWNALEPPMTIDDLLRRRLARDWDQLRVQREIESLGFVCGMDIVRPSGGLVGFGDVTPSDVPRFVCTVDVLDLPNGTDHRIFISVKFAESGEPPGWQEIKIWTGLTF